MDKLNITLKLYGGLDKNIKNYDYEKGASFKLDCSQTIVDVIEKIGIPKNRISLILSNGEIVNLNYMLKDNDFIKIFSQIGGG